jgi:hypothetical protein
LTPLSGWLKPQGRYGEARACVLLREDRESAISTQRLEIVKVQMTGSSFRGRGFGALGLLLALVLLAGLSLPALGHDDTPPLMPHGFFGAVRYVNTTDPVPEGMVVEAFVGGVKKAEGAVNAEGRYALAVGGEVADAGKTVTFVVGGVLANETAIWASGEVNLGFDLTIKGGDSGPFPSFLPCFIATAVYGTETAEEINVLREFRDIVLLPGKLGAGFVWIYYEVSPPIAEVISRYEFLRAVLRSGFIDPVVAMLNWSHDLWAEGQP